MSNKKLLGSQAICKRVNRAANSQIWPGRSSQILWPAVECGCKFVCLHFASCASDQSDSREITHCKQRGAAPEFSHTISQGRENRIKWIMMGVVFNHLWPDVGAKKATIAENLLWPSPACERRFFFNVRAAQCVCCGSAAYGVALHDATRQGRLSSCVGNQHIVCICVAKVTRRLVYLLPEEVKKRSGEL